MEEQLSPYNQALLTHYKNPYRKIGLDGQLHRGEAVNSLCGDSITIYFDLEENGIISNFSFESQACMIVVASSSMIGKWIEGKTVEDVRRLEKDFKKLIDEPNFESQEEWGVLKEISKYPTRRKCMELPVKALLAGFTD